MAEDDFSIEVEGLEETLAALDALEFDLAQRVIQPSLAAASVPVVQAVAERTPVLSGDLLEHLKVTIKMDKAEKGGTASIGFPGREAKAAWIENGHRIVGHEPDLKELGQTEPKPFVRPAYEESSQAAVDAFVKTADANVNKLAKEHGFDTAETAA